MHSNTFLSRFLTTSLLMPISLAVGCFGDSDDVGNDTGGTGTETETSTDGGGSTDTSSDTDGTDGGTTGGGTSTSDDGTTGDTGDTGTGTGTDTDVAPGCGNGVLEPGELCFGDDGTIQELSGVPSAQTAAIADFDDDEHLDVVVAYFETVDSTTTGKAAHFAGDGTSTLAEGVEISVQGNMLVRMHAGAIADSIPDLVGVDGGGSGFVRVRGDGDGTFGSVATYLDSGWDLALGDLNGDNRLDVVGCDDTGVAVRLGQADESFGALDHFGTTCGGTFGFTMGDYDGDEQLDVIVAPGGGTAELRLLPGDGNGNLGTEVPVTTTGDMRDVAVGDFDGDGTLDLAGMASSTISVFFGKKEGGFESELELSVASGGIAVAVGDMDGNDHPDIVTALTSGSVSILRSNGDRTFQDQKIFSAGMYPYDVALGDINEDGIPDIVVPSVQGELSHVLFSDI